jgi:hypothetical protein
MNALCDPAQVAVVRTSPLIRDAIYDRILPLSQVMPPIYKTVRKVGMPTLQPHQLPAVSIFLLNEIAPFFGDPDVGIPLNFHVHATIGISIVRAFDDPLYLQGGLEEDVTSIKQLLLCDPTFAARRWPMALFESVPQMRTTLVMAETAEAYAAEMRLEMTFRFQQPFTPDVPDKFKEMHVKALPDNDDNAMPLYATYYLWQQQKGNAP